MTFIGDDLSDVVSLSMAIKGLSADQAVLSMATEKVSPRLMTEALMLNGVEKNAAEAAIAHAGLSTGQKIAVNTTSKLSAAFTGLKAVITPTSLAIAGIIAAVGVFAIAWDATHTSLKEAKKTISDLQSEYEDGVESLEGLSKELTTINEKITDILSQDKISLADKEELTLLQKERVELEKQLTLQEKLNQAKATQIVAEVSNNFEKLDGDFEGDLSRYNYTKQYLEEQKASQLESVEQGILSIETYNKNMIHLENEVADKYQELFADIEDYESYRQSLLNKYNGDITNMSQGDKRLFDSISNALDDAYRSIYTDAEYYKLVVEPVFNTEQLDGLNSQIIEYFENGGTLDSTALEQKFGTEIINALKLACKSAGLVFPELLNDLFNQANIEEPAEKQFLRSRLSAGDLMQYIGQFQNMTANDLRNMDFTDGVTAQEAAFNNLLGVLGYTKESAEVVIAILEELGLILSTPINTENGITSSFEITEKQAEYLSDYQSKIDSISSSLGDLYNLSASDITSLMTDFSEYANIWEQFGVNEYGEGDVESALEAIAQKLKEETTNKIPQMRSYIEGMYEAVLNPKGNTDKLQLEVDSLELVLKDVRDGKVYDASATAKLINQYPELADAVKVLSEGYSFEEDALIDLTNTKMTAANEAIAYEIEQTEQAIKKTKERIEARSLELEALKRQEIQRRALQGRSALLDQREEQAVIFDEDGLMQSTDLKLVKYENELKELYEQLDELIKDYEGNLDGLSKNIDPEIFDWYETRIARIEDKITDFGNTVSDVYSVWSVREEALQSQITETGNLYEAQIAARDAYLAKANAVGLDQNYVEKIKLGQYDFDEETDADLIENIQEYIEWYEKAIDMENAAVESQRNLNELRTQGFEQIQTQYDAVLSDFENQASLIEAGLANAEARGQLAVQGFYQQLSANEEMNRAALVAERIALEEALKSTGLTGGEEFDRLQDEIDGVTIAIAESENALLEFENAIRDADWGIFDFNREQSQRVMGESDFLLDLLDAKKLVDEMGEFTENGLASIGLHGVNYNGYLEESIRYTKELAELEEDIKNNPDDTNYINRYNEILEKKQEMILASEQEKETIADLVRESYEAQKNALQELIDNYTEALDAEKNLYDQQKRTAEQTKRIADLRKMIASAAGDQSEETRAQVQKWQVELDSAQSDLESDQYDQYISDQKDMLNSIFEDYSDVLDEKAEDTERLFQEAMAQAKNNTGAMKNTVETAAGAVGYDIDAGVDDLLSDSSSLNTNLNQVEARLLANGLSITDGVEQIDATNNGIATNTANLVNNTTGLNQWISDVKDAISGEGGIGDKIDNAANAIVGALGATGGFNGNDNGGNAGGVNTDFFIDKISSYNKSKLDTDVSIVDLLKYHDYDSSLAARSYYYEQMGLGSDYQDKAYQNIAMLEWMKNHGFAAYASGVTNLRRNELAWTQDGGAEAIIRPSDGAILTPLKVGDSVLTSDATKNLISMMTDPANFIAQNMAIMTPDMSAINMANGGTVENNIAITIPLENVTDVQSFLLEFQRNPKIQAVIKDMIAESTLGTSSLAKYRHKI